MLKTRVLAASAFAPVLFFILWGGGALLHVACLLLTLLMALEFLSLTLAPNEMGYRLAGLVGSILVAAAVAGLLGPGGLALLPALLVGIVFGVALTQPARMQGAVVRIGIALACALYTGGTVAFLARIRDGHGGAALALAAVFCTWGGDTGAYFCGRRWGKRPLFAAISPKKTLEGAAGGIAAAMVVAMLIRLVFASGWTPGYTLWVGALAGVAGIAGDLVESLIKRSVGAKDSGRMIPGHGGVLDRFDGVMLVAPVLFALAG